MELFKHDSSEPAASVADAKPKLSLGVILRRLVVSILAWSVHCLVTAALLVVFVQLVPMVRQQFEDMDLDLPATSEITLYWSSGFINYWYLLVLAHVVIDAPIAIAVCYLPRNFQWVTWIWFTSYFLLAIFMLIVACAGVSLPFVDMTVNLS